MQSYREHPPVPALAPYLSCVWTQTVGADEPTLRHRSAPHGAVEIYTGTDGQFWVAGPREVAVEVAIPPGTTLVGVRLRLGAAESVLKVPAGELSGQCLPLARLHSGPPGPASAPSTRAGSDYTGRALQAWVRAAVRDQPPPDPVLVEVSRRLGPWPGLEGVAQVAAAMDMSPRHLRRRCLHAIGHGPRTIRRILRFQGFLALAATYRRAERVPGPGHGPGTAAGAGLARLAAEAGYADQAHLTRTCVGLTGLTPAVLLSETARVCGPHHDHAASFQPLLDLRRAAGMRA